MTGHQFKTLQHKVKIQISLNSEYLTFKELTLKNSENLSLGYMNLSLFFTFGIFLEAFIKIVLITECFVFFL